MELDFHLGLLAPLPGDQPRDPGRGHAFFVVAQLPAIEHGLQLARAEQVVGGSGAAGVGELRHGERLVDDETPGPDRVAERRPDRSLQVVGADDEVESVAWQRSRLEVGDPETRVFERAGSCQPDPVEIAIDPEDPEPVPSRRPRVTARAHRQIERVTPGSETVPHDR